VSAAFSTSHAHPQYSTFRALGTTIEVGVRDADQLDAVSAHVRETVETIEQTFSRFRPDSELAHVEQHAGVETQCSALFVELLGLACWAAASTDGWFDPTIRDALEAAGYDRDFAEVENGGPGPSRRASPAGRWRALRFDQARRTVTLPPGTRLDFGGIGKGFAVDLALRTLPALTGVIISAGGDVCVAGPPPDGGWLCDIAVSADSAVESTLVLHAGAIATSGTGRRRWRRAGVDLHHLIDPYTGKPGVSPWLAVSAAAGSCVAAEVAAKVGWLRGYAGPGWMTTQGLAARFRAPSGRVVTVGNWPADSAGETTS
jgi:thiamine biosynthesis lipoprotein